MTICIQTRDVYNFGSGATLVNEDRGKKILQALELGQEHNVGGLAWVYPKQMQMKTFNNGCSIQALLVFQPLRPMYIPFHRRYTCHAYDILS